MERRSCGDGRRAPGSGSRLQPRPQPRSASGLRLHGASRTRTGDLLGAIQERRRSGPASRAGFSPLQQPETPRMPHAYPGVLGMERPPSPKRSRITGDEQQVVGQGGRAVPAAMRPRGRRGPLRRRQVGGRRSARTHAGSALGPDILSLPFRAETLKRATRHPLSETTERIKRAILGCKSPP
jgi:hypothetical protein